MRVLQWARWPGIFGALSLGLAGCGGSGGSSTDTSVPSAAASAQTTVGRITGFGSIYVNGVEFDTNSATYRVDDAGAIDDNALAVGMIVRVRGSVNADGKTGSASDIEYDDEVEGIVANLATNAADVDIKTFDIMGIAIQVSATTTNFDGEDDATFGFDTLMNGDNVEVSGEYDGDMLIASYVEKQDAQDNDFEAKGTVDQYNGNDRFVLILRNSATLNVVLAVGAEIPDSGIADGQYVEVEGTIPDSVNAPGDFLATKVELEDDDHFDDEDSDEISLRGYLTINADTQEWTVDNVVLAFDESTEYEPASLREAIADSSADGLYVEVEGEFAGNVLLVDEIESEGDELEFKADISAISSTSPHEGVITLAFGSATGTVTVNVSAETMFRDDDATERHNLDNLMAGDKVEIKAMRALDGSIHATHLHLQDGLGYKVEGTLEALDDVSVTVAGITFGVNGETFFERTVPAVGQEVELVDHNGDGIADVVEAED